MSSVAFDTCFINEIAKDNQIAINLLVNKFKSHKKFTSLYTIFELAKYTKRKDAQSVSSDVGKLLKKVGVELINLDSVDMMTQAGIFCRDKKLNHSDTMNFFPCFYKGIDYYVTTDEKDFKKIGKQQSKPKKQSYDERLIEWNGRKIVVIIVPHKRVFKLRLI